jgi:hypothetical protein
MARTVLVVLALVIAFQAGARELTSVYVVNAVANTAGRYGTDWHTDLTYYNPHGFTLPVVLHFLRTGRDNSSGVPTVEFDLLPFETLNLWDVLGPDVFDARGTIGSLLTYADDTRISCTGTQCDFAVFSRTYTLDPYGGDGEFGQATPGFPADLGLDSSVIAYLPQIMDDGIFRTNLGVTSWTAGFVTVRFELQDSAGQVIQQADQIVPPFGHIQWSLGRTVTGGTVAAYIVAGPADAIVYPYAAVANNVSGDGVHIEAHLTPVGLTAQAAQPSQRVHGPRQRPPAARVEGFSLDRIRDRER